MPRPKANHSPPKRACQPLLGTREGPKVDPRVPDVELGSRPTDPPNNPIDQTLEPTLLGMHPQDNLIPNR